MNESSSVIIYRSKFEQQQDEFLSEFTANHPEVMLGLFGFIVVVMFFHYVGFGKSFRKF